MTVEGKTANWKATTVARHFCPRCGSALFGVSDGTGEIAIQLGVFDAAPTDLAPMYELWVARRERWLPSCSQARSRTMGIGRDAEEARRDDQDEGHCHINIGRGGVGKQSDDVAPIMRPGGRSSPAARY